MTADRFDISLGGSLDGVPITPETFPLGRLLQTLERVADAVRAEAAATGVPFDDASLSLAGVRAGSNVLGIGCSPATWPVVQKLLAALAAGTFAGVAVEAQKKLRSAFNPLISAGASVELSGPSVRTPRFSTAVELPPLVRPALLRETVSMLAKILRIGGKSVSSVQAEFPSTEQVLAARCNPRLLKQLADAGCLYETVSLDGVAEWRPGVWKLKSLRVTGFKKLATGTGRERFARIPPRLREYLNGLDAEAHMRDIRGDGDDE